MEEEKLDMIKKIRLSDPISTIYKEVAEMDENFNRPTNILESVQEHSDITRSNFYDALRRMVDRDILEKHETGGRATAYELTEEAREVYTEIFDKPLPGTEILNQHQDSGYSGEQLIEGAYEGVEELLEEGRLDRATRAVSELFDENSVEYDLLKTKIESEVSEYASELLD